MTAITAESESLTVRTKRRTEMIKSGEAKGYGTRWYEEDVSALLRRIEILESALSDFHESIDYEVGVRDGQQKTEALYDEKIESVRKLATALTKYKTGDPRPSYADLGNLILTHLDSAP